MAFFPCQYWTTGVTLPRNGISPWLVHHQRTEMVKSSFQQLRKHHIGMALLTCHGTPMETHQDRTNSDNMETVLELKRRQREKKERKEEKKKKD